MLNFENSGTISNHFQPFAVPNGWKWSRCFQNLASASAKLRSFHADHCHDHCIRISGWFVNPAYIWTIKSLSTVWRITLSHRPCLSSIKVYESIWKFYKSRTYRNKAVIIKVRLLLINDPVCGIDLRAAMCFTKQDSRVEIFGIYYKQTVPRV